MYCPLWISCGRCSKQKVFTKSTTKFLEHPVSLNDWRVMTIIFHQWHNYKLLMRRDAILCIHHIIRSSLGHIICVQYNKSSMIEEYVRPVFWSCFHLFSSSRLDKNFQQSLCKKSQVWTVKTWKCYKIFVAEVKNVSNHWCLGCPRKLGPSIPLKWVPARGHPCRVDGWFRWHNEKCQVSQHLVQKLQSRRMLDVDIMNSRCFFLVVPIASM